MRSKSGRQIAEENIKKFEAWASSASDDDFSRMVHNGKLNRKEIADECGFAKSVLIQNPSVKAALYDLEESLRRRGVLPPLRESHPREYPEADQVPRADTSSMELAVAKKRVMELENDNALLRVQLDDLKKTLKRYEVMEETLIKTGRLLW